MLNKNCNKNSNIEDADHNVMKTILDTTLNFKYDSFLELYQDIEKFTVKSTIFNRKSCYQDENINKIIRLFLYKNHEVSKKLIDFCK